MSRHVGHKVLSFARSVGGILLGIVLMGCLIAGLGEALGTTHGTRLSVLSRPGALLVAVLSLACIVALIRFWAPYLFVWLLLAALRGFAMVASGHLLNSPSIRISRVTACIVTGLTVVTVAVSFRFAGQHKIRHM